MTKARGHGVAMPFGIVKKLKRVASSCGRSSIASGRAEILPGLANFNAISCLLLVQSIHVTATSRVNFTRA